MSDNTQIIFSGLYEYFKPAPKKRANNGSLIPTGNENTSPSLPRFIEPPHQATGLVNNSPSLPRLIEYHPGAAPPPPPPPPPPPSPPPPPPAAPITNVRNLRLKVYEKRVFSYTDYLHERTPINTVGDIIKLGRKQYKKRWAPPRGRYGKPHADWYSKDIIVKYKEQILDDKKKLSYYDIPDFAEIKIYINNNCSYENIYEDSFCSIMGGKQKKTRKIKHKQKKRKYSRKN